MRIGQNPAKFVGEVAKPARITVAVLSYIPFLGGFFAEGLDVLKACLGSLWETTAKPYDLMVFDNGSCPDVVSYLLAAQREGRIQYLLLSERNVGKGGAWNAIFKGAPGEVLAYTDSDAYFYPRWLERSLEILETYPRVGMVTSRPFRTPEAFMTKTLEWAKEEPGVEVARGQFIPWETFREFDLSLGQDEAEVRKRYESTEDIRLTYRGVAAQVGASHYQFVGYRSLLETFAPFRMDRPMGQVRQLDERMNDAGYLRLMTTEPLMMNMSNSLTSVPRAGDRRPPPGQASIVRRLVEAGPVRRILLGVHDAIFRLYYTGRSRG